MNFERDPQAKIAKIRSNRRCLVKFVWVGFDNRAVMRSLLPT